MVGIAALRVTYESAKAAHDEAETACLTRAGHEVRGLYTPATVPLPRARAAQHHPTGNSGADGGRRRSTLGLPLGCSKEVLVLPAVGILIILFPMALHASCMLPGRPESTAPRGGLSPGLGGVIHFTPPCGRAQRGLSAAHHGWAAERFFSRGGGLKCIFPVHVAFFSPPPSPFCSL